MDELKKAIAVLLTKQLFCEKGTDLYNAMELAIASLNMQCKMLEYHNDHCTKDSNDTQKNNLCITDFMVCKGE